MSKLKLFLQYIKTIKLSYVLTILFLMLGSVAMIFATSLQKYIIDDVFINGEHERLILLVVAIGCCYLLQVTSFTIGPYLYSKCFTSLRYLVRKDFISHLYKLPIHKINSERVGAYIQNFTDDITKFSYMIGIQTPRAIQTITETLLLYIFVTLASPVIALTILLLSTIYIFLGKYYGKRVRKAGKDVQKKRSDLIVNIEEGISSTRESIAYNRMEWETSKFKRTFERFFNSAMHQEKLNIKNYLSSNPIMWMTNLLFIAYGGYQVIEGSMSVGLFIVTFQFVRQLIQSTQQLYDNIFQIIGSISAFDRLNEVFEQKIDVQGTKRLYQKVDHITFQNVNFKYTDEQEWILKKLTLHIPIGKKSAFVGKSGGGKSSIAQLLLQFYRPSEGELKINGINLSDIHGDDWKNYISVVFQEPYFFPDTIRNNLQMGLKGITMEKIEKACIAADIHEYILSLTDGYYTQLGDRGITISGGQRQRLAIARALLRDTEILILDEATSALDLETERIVQSNIDHVRRGKTTIVIAHRLSTVRNANKIHVLHKGGISGEGKHEELIVNNREYQELVSLESNIQSASGGDY